MTNFVKALTALKKMGRTRLASVALFVNFLLSSANTKEKIKQFCCANVLGL